LWIIVGLASLAVLITLFLCIPLDLIFRANIQERPRFSVRLIWLFGLVTSELIETGKKPEEKRVVEQEGMPGNWLCRLRAIIEILRTKGLFKRLCSFIRRVFRQIKVRELAANLKVGLHNPADTGLIFAFIAPFSLLINYFLPNSIKIEPSFTGEYFITGHLYGAVRLLPIQLAASMIGLAFSLPTLRATKRLVLYKWKREKW
jgi:hypothetical protein